VLVRLRAGLPTKEHLAPFIGNLYEDILINDRLQRSAKLHMADVYRKLNVATADPLWQMYMRTYEILWQLPSGTLARGSQADVRVNTDAQLAARLARSYAKDWLAGAGRFAALCLPYLLKDEAKDAQKGHQSWNDTKDAGKGGVPDGLMEVEAGEDDVVHPAEDPDLSGLNAAEKSQDGWGPSEAKAAPAGRTGLKTMKQYRDPFEYAQVFRASGCGTIPAGVPGALARPTGSPRRKSPCASLQGGRAQQ